MAKKLIDIGVNLTDEEDSMYQGIYRGKVVHPEDFAQMLQRGRDVGVKYFMATSGTYTEAVASLKFCTDHPDIVTTVGMHPTRCNTFGKGEMVDGVLTKGEDLIAKMKELIDNNPKKIVAIGECGLDYDRLKFCSKINQLRWFKKQLDLAEQTKLPMFLHMRAAGEDFIPIIKENRERISGGVIHSFTGNKEELEELLDLDFYIGINGCSLKTADNLAVVAALPLQKLMLETDGPWCGLRPSYAGTKLVKTTFPTKKKERFEMGSCVKDRSEPCHMIQVAEVVAGIHQLPVQEIIDIAYKNTMDLFFPTEDQ